MVRLTSKRKPMTCKAERDIAQLLPRPTSFRCTSKEWICAPRTHPWPVNTDRCQDNETVWGNMFAHENPTRSRQRGNDQMLLDTPSSSRNWISSRGSDIRGRQRIARILTTKTCFIADETRIIMTQLSGKKWKLMEGSVQVAMCQFQEQFFYSTWKFTFLAFPGGSCHENGFYGFRTQFCIFFSIKKGKIVDFYLFQRNLQQFLPVFSTKPCIQMSFWRFSSKTPIFHEISVENAVIQ